jgi:hypothetical protein
MSQRSTASQPASHSPNDGRNINLPPVQPRPSDEKSSEQAQAPKNSQDHGSEQQGQQPQAPAPQSFQAMSSRDERTAAGFVSSRGGLGVHNILNPSEPEESRRENARGSVLQSPQMERPASQHASPNIGRPGSRGKRKPQGSPPQPSGEYSLGVANPRKMLVPKSPRSISLGGQALGLQRNMQQSPLVPEGSRVYTAHPGLGTSAEIPPLPLPTAHPQSQYTYPPPQTSGPPLNRRASVAGLGPGRLPHSQSASPSPSYSSYSSQPSPAPSYQVGQSTQAPSYFSGAALTASLQEGNPSAAGPPGTEGPYMSSENIIFQGSPSGGHGSNIRMLPISTEHGHVYMPVEVQAASRVADEKRKRNAGASARFRERRKAREKESTSNIQKLEAQSKELERRLRDAEQERDFYRSERDRFRDVLYRNPETRELAMRAPPSPRLTRPPPLPLPPTGMYQPQAPQLSQEPEQQSLERAQRRRRIDPPSDYSYSLPPASTFPPVQQGYAVRPGTTEAPNLAPLQMENVSGASTGLMPAPPLGQRPFEPQPPFQRSAYDRAWPGPAPGQGPEGQGGRK